MFLLVLGAVAWAGECAEATTAATVASQLEAAEQAVSESADTFAAQLARVETSVDCLGEVAPPSLAARLHRLHGIGQARSDELAALPWFLAARAIEPDAPLVQGADLSKSPLGEAYDSVDPRTIAKESVPAPAEGALVLDGARTLTRGRDLPVLFQLEGADGVTASVYVGAGQPLPPYPAAPPPPVPAPPGSDLAAAPPAAPAANRGGPHRGLLWSGVGVGLLASGLFAGSHAALSRFDALPVGSSREDAEGLQSTTNTLTLASAGTFAVSVGLVGTSLLVGGR